MHKCFISFKKEDAVYRDYLVENLGGTNFVDKSLDRVINSEDGDYVMEVIRRDYLCDSTVTLFLIGEHSSENEGYDWMGDRNYFIKRELAASLYNGKGNTRSGILGIVLPRMESRVFSGKAQCTACGKVHTIVNVIDSTVIREFSYNYYTRPHAGCAWTEDERYCVIVSWSEFINDPERHINQAYEKRYSSVAQLIRIKNLDR